MDKYGAPFLVMDEYWNVDFSKGSCRDHRDPNQVCTDDGSSEVLDYEAAFSNAFGSDQSCHGITLVTYAGHGEPFNAPRGARWQLMLNFNPGYEDRRGSTWTLTGPKACF
jgi:hypothetical protein